MTLPIPIPLRLLDGPALRPRGATCGVPFARGQIRSTAFHLRAGDVALPTQTWILARWPDASIKWLGVAALLAPEHGATLHLHPGDGPAPAQAATVRRPGVEVFQRVETGSISVDVGDRGVCLIQEARRDGHPITGGVRLIARRQERLTQDGWQTTRTEECLGEIDSCTVEQAGPVRILMRLDGRHRGQESGRRWLPFRVRLEFFAGSDVIGVSHTLVYDGRSDRDFIAGLGLRAEVPLDAPPQDRQVRLVGEGGDVWCEPVRWVGNIFASTDPGVARQVLGEVVGEDPAGRLRPCFGGFQLLQHGCDQFRLRKRTGPSGSWIDVGTGARAPGLMALGQRGGGLAMSVAEFWEAWPKSLEIVGAESPMANLTAWFWSAEAEAMDLRHYGDRDYRPTYEAVNPDPDTYSDATGIARTSRLDLWLMPAGTPHAALAATSASTRQPPQPVVDRDHMHACRIFGAWAPRRQASSAASRIAEELDRHLTLYLQEIDARRWYGFWNHGDGMLGYDRDRGTWRYDIGGFAWWNAELAGDLYWWYAFLHTGRAECFHLAAAMTRHVAEVDTFHLGPWRGLGSRHNVVHWGCPCKEPRISQALPKRILHYLTADPRLGDLLDEVVEADATPATNDMIDGQRRVRMGPNWLAFAANWLSAWERSGDDRWRARIERGLDGILAAPLGLMQTDPFDYDPATGAMQARTDLPFGSWFSCGFGGDQLLIELVDLLERRDLAPAMVDMARHLAVPRSEHHRLPEAVRIHHQGNVSPMHAKLVAWAAGVSGDASLAKAAWRMFACGEDRNDVMYRLPAAIGSHHDPLSGRMVQGWDQYLSFIAQWGMTAIALLALAPEHVPEDLLRP